MAAVASISATGKACGRLDFMGGVADYSGSHVLEAGIAKYATCEATLIAGGDTISVESKQFGSFSCAASILISAGVVEAGTSGARPLAAVKVSLEEAKAPRWCHYVLGCVAAYLLHIPSAAYAVRGSGLRLSIASEVPAGYGVSSSAPLEMAVLDCMRALLPPKEGTVEEAAAEPLRLAHLGQLAENQVAGVPCGLMDQLACQFGRPGALLPIKCRPDQCSTPVALPPGIVALGWPSMVVHDVGASPYATARCACFMAKRILEADVLSRKGPSEALDATVREELDEWTRGRTGKAWQPGDPIPHLACLPLSWLQLHALGGGEGKLPERITGAEFAEKYGVTSDALSKPREDAVYEVGAAAYFACGEDARVRLAVGLLRGLAKGGVGGGGGGAAAGPSSAPAAGGTGAGTSGGGAGGRSGEEHEALRAVGELMLQGHAAYSRIGLGCEETDRIVGALMGRLGAGRGVFGARVSGGGSGGTVAVLCREDAVPAVEALARSEGLRFGEAEKDPSKFPGLIL